MKSIATDAIRSTYLQLDPGAMEHNFEIFGLDFMIDDQYNVWLIEVNTNPCLEISSKLLGRIIPNMLEHALRLSLDVIFPPPAHYPNSQKYMAPDNPLGRLMYELIFD
jgi:tubulin polyglutamylase TTLL1